MTASTASQGASRWPRPRGVAALLLVIALLGATLGLAALDSHDAGSRAGFDRLVSRSIEVAPPARISLGGVTSQPVPLSNGVTALVAIACCLWRPVLSRALETVPPRFAPGRRGRALLHAYLN